MKNLKEQVLVNHPQTVLSNTLTGWTQLRELIDQDEEILDRKCPIVTP